MTARAWLLRWTVRSAALSAAAFGARKVLSARRRGNAAPVQPWTPLPPEPDTDRGPVAVPPVVATPPEAGTSSVSPSASATSDVAVEPAAQEPAVQEPAVQDPAAPTWIEPTEATCPLSHPVKANADSGIYHLPGGLSYDRVVPERCYRTPQDAEADGFRAAKR